MIAKAEKSYEISIGSSNRIHSELCRKEIYSDVFKDEYNKALRGHMSQELARLLLKNTKTRYRTGTARQQTKVTYVTYDLLSHMGFDADIMVEIAAHASPVILEGSQDQRLILQTSGAINTNIALSCDNPITRLEGNKFPNISAKLPSSYFGMLKGEPLKTILSHPVLDRHDIRIENINESFITTTNSPAMPFKTISDRLESKLAAIIGPDHENI